MGRWLVWTGVWLAALVGCDDAQVTDPRFATPERTVATLLATHGLADESQDAIRARIAERGSFELRDAETWRMCFTDLDRPGGEGMAGYVLGLLAAGREDLRYETIADRGYAMPREGIRVVLERGQDGAFRIVLAESVPEEVQRGLLQVEENARRRRAPPGP
ncbi:MAG: hypothetical protein H6719_34680 [Sandaracinaceae bacterium]|nr:hypothetical protein [Sandaracinaceae bacterium]